MITPISEQGKDIIRRFTDKKTNIPDVLKTFIYTPAELMAGEMKTSTPIDKQLDVLKHFR